MVMGRPTLYREEYCERVIELGKQGKSVAEWASDIGVARSTLFEWAEHHPNFSTALMRAKTEEQAYFERTARENFDNRNFNSNLWIKSAQARFRDDYTERREIETSGAMNFTGLPAPQIGSIQFTVVDPKKLETEDLENLANILQSQNKSQLTIEHEMEDEDEQP
jgi:hypothetical protein